MSALALPLLVLSGTALAAPGPRAVDPKVAAQVPVIAGKLAQWRGAWGAAGGKLACKTVRSTGDEDIDRIGCAAMIACVKPIYPELKAIADGKGTEADKQRRIGARLAGQERCLKEHRGEGIAALALARGRT
jgi:hypothetical protein